jgi:alanine racemase
MDFSAPFWQTKHILTDSRKLLNPAETLFFALKGKKHDGHQFIEQLYRAGVRRMVVAPGFDTSPFQEATFFTHPSPLSVLQAMVAHHRSRFHYPVIGITGSNGKTLVKEWLYQLLAPDFSTVKSPKSYNSQLGVPLSVWEMAPWHQLGIFEAGISQPGEMQHLQAIIQPTYGIFTNLGTAHDEGFQNHEEKLREKMQLFTQCERLICCLDHPLIVATARQLGIPLLTWSFSRAQPADVYITALVHQNNQSLIDLAYLGKFFRLILPFTDQVALENAMHCVACLLFLGISPQKIQERVLGLKNIPMRLEVKQGARMATLVDDTYNNDLYGLKVALDFFHQQDSHKPHAVILSDLLESGMESGMLYQEVADLLKNYPVSSFIGVGPQLKSQQAQFQHIDARFFTDMASLVKETDLPGWAAGKAVLLKGARSFGFETLVQLLQPRQHATRLEINLEALAQNFTFYRSLLAESTKIMVMVKALAYGSSSYEVAALLQYLHADYLAVAYTEEGIRLREHGIRTPIMVMNPLPDALGPCIRYGLEPVVFSHDMLQALEAFLSLGNETKSSVPLHVVCDTGMKRLGFTPEQATELAGRLQQLGQGIVVKSVFTHLAAADDPGEDDFTLSQLAAFQTFASNLQSQLGYPLLRHALNTAGIARFPDFRMNMVRLGIGLFGIDPGLACQHQLRQVATLKTVVSQLKQVAKGESVGYGRSWVAQRPTTIATLAIGYADGFDRRFSNGVGKVQIRGQWAPVAGRVCMDMTMVDVTGMEVEVGDEVVVFGETPSIQDLAHWAGTIPYEILTNVNERVKRVFYEP